MNDVWFAFKLDVLMSLFAGFMSWVKEEDSRWFEFPVYVFGWFVLGALVLVLVAFVLWFLR